MQARKGRFKDGRGYWYNGTKRRVRLISASEHILKTAKEDFEAEFNIQAKKYKKGKENCYVIETKHRKVLEKLNSLGVPLGLKSHKIRVPNIVFESSNKFKINFIKALFSCDGYVDKRGREIDYYSKSRKFLEDLNILLSHFKVQSTIRNKIVNLNNKIFHNYQLYITDHTSLENFKKIGFVDKLKEERLNKHKFWKMKRRKRTQYLDSVLFGNRITKISRINNIKEVYDLHVPKNNSFIANGVISHNSGKSYSLSVMAEEMANLQEDISKNLAIVMLDTMGVFWTMKYPNTRDQNLLEEWNLKPQGLDVKILVPIGFYKEYKKSGLPADKTFAIKTSELDAEDWCDAFEVNLTGSIGVLIEKTIYYIRKKYTTDYAIEDIIEAIYKDKTTSHSIKDAAINRFNNANTWGLFSTVGTEIKDILRRGEVTVIDLSAYTKATSGSSIKNLVVGIISKKLLIERILSRKQEELDNINIGEGIFIDTEKELEKPLVWIMLDEAHEFLAKDKDNATSRALVQLLREGRQPGISLVLATQEPGVLRQEVLTQSDIVIGHRLTAKVDLDALNSLMQSYHLEDINTHMNNLPKLKGSAIVLDDNSEKIIPIGVRPKMSWHGGEAPSAIKNIKREEIANIIELNNLPSTENKL